MTHVADASMARGEGLVPEQLLTWDYPDSQAQTAALLEEEQYLRFYAGKQAEARIRQIDPNTRVDPVAFREALKRGTDMILDIGRLEADSARMEVAHALGQGLTLRLLDAVEEYRRVITFNTPKWWLTPKQARSNGEGPFFVPSDASEDTGKAAVTPTKKESVEPMPADTEGSGYMQNLRLALHDATLHPDDFFTNERYLDRAELLAQALTAIGALGMGREVQIVRIPDSAERWQANGQVKIPYEYPAPKPAKSGIAKARAKLTDPVYYLRWTDREVEQPPRVSRPPLNNFKVKKVTPQKSQDDSVREVVFRVQDGSWVSTDSPDHIPGRPSA